MVVNLARLVLDVIDLVKGYAIDDVRKMVPGEGQVKQFEISHKNFCSSTYWQAINVLKGDGWIHPCRCLEAMKDFEATANRNRMSEKVHKDQWEKLDTARVNCKLCLGTGYVNTLTIQRNVPQDQIQEAEVINMVPRDKHEEE